MDVPTVSRETLELIEAQGFPFKDSGRGKRIVPSIYRVQKWLREEFDIHITITPDVLWGASERKIVYNSRVRRGEYLNSVWSESYFDVYEEALEAGIQIALKWVKR